MVHVYRFTILAVLNYINQQKVKYYLRLREKRDPFEIYCFKITEHCSRRGEVFGTRGGCDFVADCANPDPPAPLPPGEVQLCPMYVMDVCLCPAGLLRNSEGACVERRHC